MRERQILTAVVSCVFWLAAGFPGVAPAAGDPAGEVTLPLGDYLSLQEAVARAERARAAASAERQPPVAALLSVDWRATIVDRVARLSGTLEAEVRGAPLRPVRLPVPGLLLRAEVRPGGSAALRRATGGLELVAPEGGRYTIAVEALVPLEEADDRLRLRLPPHGAPVASLAIGIPPDHDWRVEGAAEMEETEEVASPLPGRVVHLAPEPGRGVCFEIFRRGPAVVDELLALTQTVTVLDVRPGGTTRHDLVLYDVARGGLDAFELSLPTGLDVVSATTDEGVGKVRLEGRDLVVRRSRKLSGQGWVEVVAPVGDDATVRLEAVRAAFGDRGRYFALAAEEAVTAELPDGWRRADPTDLPAAARQALAGRPLLAVWRAPQPEAPLEVTVSRPGAVPALQTIASRRTTTTLVTLEGRLVHRDVFLLSRAGTSVALELAPDSLLWSAAVDGVAVRPLEVDGRTVIPLLLRPAGGAVTVETVVVEEGAAQLNRRGTAAWTLPRVDFPVVEHVARVLLPEGRQYRFAGGTLRAVTDMRLGRRPTPRPAAAPGNASSAATFAGQGTGRVVGTLSDDEGAALPGVTVGLDSTTFGGEPLVAVSDRRGIVDFRSLPPGRYSLTAELDGFSTIEYPSVVVETGAVFLDITLSPAVEETITVTSESPLLDERRLTTGVTLSGGGGGIPRAADPWKVVNQTPGVRVDRISTGSASVQETLFPRGAGLVEGVRPLPVAIPESGKLLTLVGVLPPEEVRLEIAVRPGRGPA